MSYYSYSGLGAAASPATINVSLPSLASLSNKQLYEMPYEKLLPLALAKARDPAINNQLSYIGQFFTVVGNAAVREAGGQDAADLFFATAPVLKEMLSSIADAYSDIMGATVSSIGAVVTAAGPMAPIMLAALKLGFNVLATATEEARQKAQKDCRDVYVGRRYPNGGTGYGGAVMPCDLLAHKKTNLGAAPDSTALADTFAQLELPHAEMWQRLNVGNISNMLFSGGKPTPANPQFEETKRLLKVIRLAIQRSYGVEGSDGGAALWPVYLDLMWAQFMPNTWRQGGGGKLGMISKASFRALFCRFMPPYNYYAPGAAAAEKKYGSDGCCKYEDRGYREAMETLRQWDLTIDPIYAQDQQKAAELRAYIDKAIAELKRPKLVVNPSILGLFKPKPAVKRSGLIPKAAPQGLAAHPAAAMVLTAAIVGGGLYAWHRYGRKKTAR